MELYAGVRKNNTSAVTWLNNSMNVCMHSFIQNTISNYFMTRFNLYSPTIKTERFEFMAGH